MRRHEPMQSNPVRWAIGLGVVLLTLLALGRARNTQDVAQISTDKVVAAKNAAPQTSAVIAAQSPASSVPSESQPSAQPASAQPVREATATTPPRGVLLGVGDRIRINVYEVLERDEDKWKSAAARMKPSAPSVDLRTELSGEFIVDEAGRIAMPALGAIVVAQQPIEKIEADIRTAFSRRLGRGADVLVSVLERRPIYVMGNVKVPGVYKFTPGNTILHAVALAGGFGAVANDIWQSVELNREAGQVTYSTEQLGKMLVQRSVLAAELANAAPATDPLMSGVLPAADVSKRLAAEVEKRSPVVSARKQREQALAAVITKATEELETTKERVKSAAGLAAIETDRLAKLRVSYDKGHVNELRFSEAQLSKSKAIDQKAQAEAAVTQAEQRIYQAKQAFAEFQSQVRVELDRDIRDATRQIDQMINARKLGSANLATLSSTAGAGGQSGASLSDPPQFELIRRTEDGRSASQIVPSMTPLMSGDLVVVRGGLGQQSDTQIQKQISQTKPNPKVP